MSRFKKLSHVLWHCQYHIVWIPKYRYKVLNRKDRRKLGLIPASIIQQPTSENVRFPIWSMPYPLIYPCLI